MLNEERRVEDGTEEPDQNGRNEIELFLEQLRTVREIASGFGSAPEALNNQQLDLTLLNKYAPSTLDVLVGFANLNLKSDQYRLKLIEAMPDEVKFWPIEEDRPFFLAAAALGILPEAFKMVTEKFKDDVKKGRLNKPKAGFGS